MAMIKITLHIFCTYVRACVRVCEREINKVKGHKVVEGAV